MGAGPYWDETFNFVRGCSHCSPGCDRCWAERMAMRLSGADRPYHGLVRDGEWTGEVRFAPEPLERLRRARSPRRWFCDMGDPFHPQAPFAWVEKAIDAAANAPAQLVLLLTKRPERMLRWAAHGDLVPAPVEPQPNVMLGATACTWNELTRALVALDELSRLGWRTWISIEPLLETVFEPTEPVCRWPEWGVVGCEAGPGARACPESAIRSAVNLLRSHGTKVFLKQMTGDRPTRPLTELDQFPEDLRGLRALPEVPCPGCGGQRGEGGCYCEDDHA